MPDVMKHRSFHADYAIQEHSVVVICVPEIKHCENDKQSYENSHFVSLLHAIIQAPNGRGEGL
jgi:hypothetical protein